MENKWDNTRGFPGEGPLEEVRVDEASGGVMRFSTAPSPTSRQEQPCQERGEEFGRADTNSSANKCSPRDPFAAEEADEDDPVDQEHRYLQAFAEEADEDEPVDQEHWCIQEEAAAVSHTYFRPAKTFSTPPTGCVYKRGNKGLGFYCDDQRQIISLNDLVPGGPSGVAPLRLMLDHVIPSGNGDVDVEGIPEETAGRIRMARHGFPDSSSEVESGWCG